VSAAKRVDPAEDARRRWTANPGKCINEECRSKGKKRKAHSRGLCHACGMQLWLLVKAKKITYRDAESQGLCLPRNEMRKKRFSIVA